MFWITLIVIIILIAVVHCFCRNLKSEMRSELNNSVCSLGKKIDATNKAIKTVLHDDRKNFERKIRESEQNHITHFHKPNQPAEMPIQQRHVKKFEATACQPNNSPKGDSKTSTTQSDDSCIQNEKFNQEYAESDAWDTKNKDNEPSQGTD